MTAPTSNDTILRDRILAAAVSLFSEHGFEGVSTRDLGERSRCNIATVRYHFGSKQEVYEAAFDHVYSGLMRRVHESLAALIAELPAPPYTPALVLPRLVPRMYEAAWKERVGVRLILRELLEHGKLPPRIEREQALARLSEMTAIAAAGLGVPPTQLRRAFVAGSFLVSRYVTHDEDSLARSFEVDTSFEAHAVATQTLLLSMQAWLVPATGEGGVSR